MLNLLHSLTLDGTGLLILWLAVSLAVVAAANLILDLIVWRRTRARTMVRAKAPEPVAKPPIPSGVRASIHRQHARAHVPSRLAVRPKELDDRDRAVARDVA